MKLITDTHSSDPNYNGDMDHFIIEITAERAGLYLRLREDIEKLKEKHGKHTPLCIEIWDGFDAFEYSDDLEVLDQLNLCKYLQAPDDFETPDPLIQRTDLNTCRVYDNGLTFRCYEKHGNVSVDSPRIRWKDIEQIAAGETELKKVEETA